MAIRMGKVLMLLSISIFFALTCVSNLVDYQTNFIFVEHVLSMDTTFQSPNLMWRSIHNPTIHHLAYWFVIIWHAAVAILCFLGALKLIKHRSSPSLIFNAAKGPGVIALTCGFLLYSFAFVTIGGEWFAMWQSTTWNALKASHTLMSMIGIALIFLVVKDE